MLVLMYVHTVCIISVYAGPLGLTVNIMKNVTNLSIAVQLEVVNDFLPTTYTVVWTDERADYQVATVDYYEQTSYTTTGLTLDTVYTITVTAANRCGQGPEFRNSIPFSADTTSTTSSISPTVTTSTNPMTIISTVNPSSTTTTTALVSSVASTTTTTTTLHTSTLIKSSIIPTVITYPSTTTTSNIVNSPNPTIIPADTTTVDEISKFSSTAT